MLTYSFYERNVPDETLINGVVVVPFFNNQCILANITRRGYEFPAGHKEKGEVPEKTAKREVLEETGAVIDELYTLGYVLVHNDDKPIKNYPFPDSYLKVFAGICTRIDKLLCPDESSGYLICKPEDVKKHLGYNQELYLSILKTAKKYIR